MAGTTQLWSVFRKDELVVDCGGLSRGQCWTKLKKKLARTLPQSKLHARFLRDEGYDVRMSGKMARRA